MKTRIVSLVILSLVFSLRVGAVEQVNPDQDLEKLGAVWEKARNEYRDGLKSKRDEVDQRIEEVEKRIPQEQAAEALEKSVNEMRDLSKEREKIEDKIREINAGDVVKFSNGRNTVLKILTKQ